MPIVILPIKEKIIGREVSKKEVKWMNLNQKEYRFEDRSGNSKMISSTEIKCIATYNQIAPEFYKWECGVCTDKNTIRNFGSQIHGKALNCQTCGEINLLVCTQTEYMWKLAMLAFEAAPEEANKIKEETATLLI